MEIVRCWGAEGEIRATLNLPNDNVSRATQVGAMNFTGGVFQARAGLFRVLAVAVLASAVAACSFSSPSGSKKRPKEFFSEAKYGPASPRVVNAGKDVPKGGGRAMVGKPYRVAGKTYIPRDDRDYQATGMASWYGSAFHGRLTANGEVYDMNALTAAHPTLPLPSYARVTNTNNGKSVIVRINDRGPFAHNRIIDLSQRAADMLAFRHNGTAKVHVEYVGPAQMDGLDEQMLLASYRDGGPGAPSRPGNFNDTIMVAEAPLPRQRPAIGYQPAFEDSIGPLIADVGFANGYAAMPQRTSAQMAADALAEGAPDNLQTALDRVVQRRSQQAGAATGTVVQLGSFANGANAQRIAESFTRFGKAAVQTSTVNGQALNVVRVTLAAGVNTQSVVSAASEAGLKGAFVVD